MRRTALQVERTDSEPAAAQPKQRWIAPFAWAGIIGPLLFTAGFLIQEAFRIEEYSPIAEVVSALEAGPNGWIQQVNFVVFGLLTFAFAVGLHIGVRPGRTGKAGPGLLFVSGVGSLVAGIFPLREDSAGVTYDPGGHMVGGVTFFVASAVGLIVLSPRLAHDPEWRRLSRYALASGIVAMAGFMVMGALVMADDAPLHDYAGLGQRLMVLVLFACRIALAVRLLRVAARRDVASHS